MTSCNKARMLLKVDTKACLSSSPTMIPFSFIKKKINYFVRSTWSTTSHSSFTRETSSDWYGLKEKCILRWMKGLKTTLLTSVMAAIISSGSMRFFNSSNALFFSRPERTSKLIPQYGQVPLAFNKSLRHFLWMGLLQQIVILQLRKFTSISFSQTPQIDSMPANSGSRPNNLRERLNAIFGGSHSPFMVVC